MLFVFAILASLRRTENSRTLLHTIACLIYPPRLSTRTSKGTHVRGAYARVNILSLSLENAVNYQAREKENEERERAFKEIALNQS